MRQEIRHIMQATNVVMPVNDGYLYQKTVRIETNLVNSRQYVHSIADVADPRKFKEDRRSFDGAEIPYHGA